MPDNQNKDIQNGAAQKSGTAVIIGRPNVGKSTLMNELIGQKIAITSDKPQTTRNRIQTVYTDERGQIIFLDTPGMIRKSKNKLGQYMINVARHTLADADVVIWLVEASDYIGESDKEIAASLKDTKKPLILAINKTDMLGRKEEVLPIIEKYQRLVKADEIVPISALKAKNTDELLNVIFRYLPAGPMYFDEDTVTDQPMRQIAAEIVREKALRMLSDEIPHGIAVVVDRMTERNASLMDVEATVVCERESHKAIIIGKGGSMLKRIGTSARRDIEELTGMQVNLKLWVKVRDSWRDSDIQMKNFGYDKNKL